MRRLPLLAGIVLAEIPLAAQTPTTDPHLDLPKDGRSDPTSQFDLERAGKGGLNAAAIDARDRDYQPAS
ncbi:hypothetical protein [Sphingomonas sp.]|uniref:hypothetical protein n=1 Tax=Sphingomonas sp. TaxID=28214 RepID=UPI0035B2CDA7